MRFLFSHNNYPAQFRRLIPSLVDAGHEVVFLCRSQEWHAPSIQGVRLIKFEPHRAAGGASIHPYLRRFEEAVLQGQAAYRALQPLVQSGWEPDWIITHVGFGNGLYLSDVFPTELSPTQITLYCFAAIEALRDSLSQSIILII